MNTKKRPQVEGLTAHLMTIAAQIDPNNFIGSAESGDFKRLIDALIRHVTGVRPIQGKPLMAKIPSGECVERVRFFVLEIHRALRWRMPYYPAGQDQILLAAVTTAWVLYRYSGRLPDNFGIPRKKEK